MSLLRRLFGSSLGQKYLMAVSGLVLVGFVCGHLVGNLQFFLPPRVINRYAHFLHSNPALLWGVRLTLLALVLLHLVTGLRLWRANRAARPTRYASPAPPFGASLAARTTLLSGLIIAVFVVYHLLHYTVRVETINGTAILFRDLREPGTGYPDVFAMMVAGFQVWPVALFYAVGVVLLALHLSHGVAAMFQSLGWRNPLYAPCLARLARLLAVGVLVGYLSIPAAVMLGRGQRYLAEVVEHSARTAAVAQSGKEAVK